MSYYACGPVRPLILCPGNRHRDFRRTAVGKSCHLFRNRIALILQSRESSIHLVAPGRQSFQGSRDLHPVCSVIPSHFCRPFPVSRSALRKLRIFIKVLRRLSGIRIPESLPDLIHTVRKYQNRQDRQRRADGCPRYSGSYPRILHYGKTGFHH